MDESTALATKAELEQVKKEQKQMVIELKVLGGLLNALAKEVAHLSEKTSRMGDTIDALDAKVEALATVVSDGFAELRSGNAALMSTILTIGK